MTEVLTIVDGTQLVWNSTSRVIANKINIFSTFFSSSLANALVKEWNYQHCSREEEKKTQQKNTTKIVDLRTIISWGLLSTSSGVLLLILR